MQNETKINDGGPAFPRSSQGPSGDLDFSTGMTLRQWYAGMALQGLMRHPDSVGESEAVIARWAFLAADAMIAYEADEQEPAKD